MPSRRNDTLRREQQNLIDQIAGIVTDADDTPSPRRFRPRPALLLALGAVLAIHAFAYSAYADLKARFDAQTRRVAALEQQLSPQRTVSIPELPPPYETVRSRFEGWHICATDDCGIPSSSKLSPTRL